MIKSFETRLSGAPHLIPWKPLREEFTAPVTAVSMDEDSPPAFDSRFHDEK
jgi:hypothetical protein